MKRIFKKILLVLLFPLFISSVFSLDASKTVDARGKKMQWINNKMLNGTNNVRKIIFDDNVKYFKSCIKHMDKKSFVKMIVSEYCNECDESADSSDESLLMGALMDENNLDKFLKMGVLWESNNPICLFLDNKIKSDDLRIPDSIAKTLNINLKNFFTFSSRYCTNYRITYGAKPDELQTQFLRKSLATYTLAKYFGVENVIVNTEFVKLITDYGEKFGILTDQSEGLYYFEVLENNINKITPNFHRELSNLQVLDIITGEFDHSRYNCTFKVSGDTIFGIMAFDNDYGYDNSELSNASNLPRFMDKNFATKILHVENKDIETLLKNILSKSELKVLISRIEKLRHLMINRAKCNRLCFLNPDQWSRAALRKELSCSLPSGYLRCFCDLFKIKY